MSKDVETNRDFYPEDAQERNIEEARQLAVENHEHDNDPDYNGARIDDKSPNEIPARPDVTASKNPEQVNTTENENPAVYVEHEDAEEENIEESKKQAAKETKKESK